MSANRKPKLSRKLEQWWELDFRQIQVEVKRVFRADIPIKQRAEWETYLTENAEQVKKLTAEIETAEREINYIVYHIFDLTSDEIKLLEASLEGQHQVSPTSGSAF